MKKLSQLIVILQLLCISFATKSFANNEIKLVSILPNGAGPYSGGAIITASYTLDYTMVQGKTILLQIEFNTALLEFVSGDFAPSTNGVFHQVTNPAPLSPFVIKFETDPFLAGDNNYRSSTSFTLSFRVKSTTCNPLNENINAQVSTFDGTTETFITSVNASVVLLNSGNGQSVSLSLLQGDDCNMGLYQINSFGLDKDAAAGNSYFNLLLPAGASLLKVYNTLGTEIFFNPASTFTAATYKWERSGDPAQNGQIHYALIEFNKQTLCSGGNGSYNIDVQFASFSICDPTQPRFSTINRKITTCCTPGTQTPVHGVLLSKKLYKYPLRYFPEPNDCKEHDYVIEADNLSGNDINDFELKDILSGISNVPNAIEISGISVTFTSYLGNSTTFEIEASGTVSPLFSQVLQSGTMVPLLNVLPPPYPDLTIKGKVPFPKFSKLIIHIRHKLKSSIAVNYINKSTLNFSITNTPYSMISTVRSRKDNFEPSVTVEKLVRNVSDNGPWSHATNASPGETVEFQVKIKNYGMANLNDVKVGDGFSEKDGAGNPISNIIPDVAGTIDTINTSSVYAQYWYGIKQSITSSLNNNGFGFDHFKIIAAPCDGITELVFTYKAKVKASADVLCNSTFTNVIELNWRDANNKPQMAFDQAVVNIDLFKNIVYKLEASCDKINWQVGNISGVPGKPIWYRATIKNYNNYTVDYLKMMVQLPNLVDNLSNHTVSGEPVFELKTVVPGAPNPNDLHPELPVNLLPGYSNSVTTIPDNWLNTGNPLPNPSPLLPGIAYYASGSLLPQKEFVIEYMVIVPIGQLNDQFITAMGISRGATNNRGSCPVLRKTNLTLSIAQCNSCDCNSGCDQIMFSSKIEKDLVNSKLKVSLYNMVSSYSGFSIDEIDVVVHQPYEDQVIVSTPFNKKMLPYSLSNLTGNSNPPFTISAMAAGQRFFHITNNGPLNFSSLNFEIYTKLRTVSHTLVVPINIIFRDKTKNCTICEKTIYLKI